MPLFITAALIIGSIVGVAVLVVAAVFAIGAAVYDVVAARKEAPAKSVAEPKTRTDMEKAEGRIFVERSVARGFVIAGGAFWSIAIFAGLFSWLNTGIAYALLGAFFPMLAVLVTLVIGWYYERAAAAVLVLATIGVIAWGVIYQFEAGVWGIMTFAFIGPMLTAATLFWMARRDQEAYEFELSAHPELAPIRVSAGQ